MSRRSSRQRKRKKLQLEEKQNKPSSSAKGPKRRMGLDTALGIAGLLIGILGLIALRPQLSVALDAPLEAGQPYSPVFRITNSGLTAITRVHAYAYLYKAQVGGLQLNDNISVNPNWKATTLERGESFSVPAGLLRTQVVPNSFDVAVVIEYAPYGIPFISQNRIFRWIGAKGPDGNMTLLPQPASEIEKSATEAVERYKKLQGPVSSN